MSLNFSVQMSHKLNHSRTPIGTQWMNIVQLADRPDNTLTDDISDYYLKNASYN